MASKQIDLLPQILEENSFPSPVLYKMLSGSFREGTRKFSWQDVGAKAFEQILKL